LQKRDMSVFSVSRPLSINTKNYNNKNLEEVKGRAMLDIDD